MKLQRLYERSIGRNRRYLERQIAASSERSRPCVFNFKGMWLDTLLNVKVFGSHNYGQGKSSCGSLKRIHVQEFRPASTPTQGNAA